MQNIVLYGMGSWVDNHYLWLKKNFSIIAAYDRDSNKKIKSKEMGIPFWSLEELKRQQYEAILITSTYEKEISNYLKNELQLDVKILSGNQLYKKWELQHYEKINCMGEKYPDKTFALVQCGDETGSAGLLGLFCSFVREISNALRKQWIPVVDMMDFYNIYHENWEQVGEINTWEWFFKQPYPEYHVEDAKNAKKTIYLSKNWKSKDRMAKYVIHDMKLRNEYHMIYKRYMQLSDKLLSEYKEVRKKVFNSHKKEGEKILGVSIRGTDYNSLKPYLHEIQPTLEQVVDKISESIERWKIDKIYVNSDEEKSVQYIKDTFPGMVFSMDYQRFDSYEEKEMKGLIGTMRFTRENDAYRRGADYLMSTLLLAECDCFIGSVNGGCVATLIMTEGFEEEYIFDNLGVYGIDDDAYAFTPDGKPIYVR